MRVQPVDGRLQLLQLTTPTGHVTRGLVGLVPVDAAVHPHEDVDPERVARQLRRWADEGVEDEPVVLLHSAGGAVERLTSDVRGDGVHDVAPHVADAVGPDAVVADGHHRWTAGRIRGGSVLAWLVDADAAGPVVHSLHRVVPAPLDRLLAAAAHPGRPAEPDEPASGLVLTDGRRTVAVDVAPGVLPVAALHDRLLPAAGLSAGPGEVEVHRTVTAALAAAVRVGGTAVLLPPTPLVVVLATARGGGLMPWKSTWFEPKPPRGLVVRRL